MKVISQSTLLSGAQSMKTEGFGNKLREVDLNQIVQNYKALKIRLELSVLYYRQYKATVGFVCLCVLEV